MDGFEVINEWQNRNVEIPIIALTADVSNNIQDRFANPAAIA
jgi:CheY-like chemotaxis protein